jgi:hypothetical protein
LDQQQQKHDTRDKIHPRKRVEDSAADDEEVGASQGIAIHHEHDEIADKNQADYPEKPPKPVNHRLELHGILNWTSNR